MRGQVSVNSERAVGIQRDDDCFECLVRVRMACGRREE